MMVAVGLARVGVGVKIRTPAYTLIYPHLDQQMIIMTLIMGRLVMVVKYHQMLSTTVHKLGSTTYTYTSWSKSDSCLIYFVRRAPFPKVPLFQKCPLSKLKFYSFASISPVSEELHWTMVFHFTLLAILYKLPLFVSPGTHRTKQWQVFDFISDDAGQLLSQEAWKHCPLTNISAQKKVPKKSIAIAIFNRPGF